MDVDLPSTFKVSYKQKLVRSNPQDISLSFSPTVSNFNMEYEEKNILNSKDFIPLSSEEKARLYKPWGTSLIIKVFGRKIGYMYLLFKLQSIWKLSKEINLMDLGNELYLVKFKLEQNYSQVIHAGPWFKGRHFLNIRQWEPKFRSNHVECKQTAIWARLPKLTP